METTIATAKRLIADSHVWKEFRVQSVHNDNYYRIVIAGRKDGGIRAVEMIDMDGPHNYDPYAITAYVRDFPAPTYENAIKYYEQNTDLRMV